MSNIDPSRCGKCWSCKHCEDIGTFTYEDYLSYMRKCTKYGHDYVDSCQSSCSDYEWDGHTPENGKSSSYSSGSSSSSSSSSSSYSSSSYSSSSDGSGCGKVILIIAIIVGALIAFMVFGGANLFSKKAPASADPDTTLVTTMHISAVVKTSGSNLRMRSGPSTDYDVVESLPNGASVTILDQKDSWSMVDYNGTVGWCFTEYLKEQ